MRLEVRSIFLGISKAFNKLWHDGAIYKLTPNGMSGKLLNRLQGFFKEEKQCVVLNRQGLTWENIIAGVRQSSILGPLLLFICINNLTESLTINAKLFQMIVIFYAVHETQTSANDLNKEQEIISNCSF